MQFERRVSYSHLNLDEKWPFLLMTLLVGSGAYFVAKSFSAGLNVLVPPSVFSVIQTLPLIVILWSVGRFVLIGAFGAREQWGAFSLFFAVRIVAALWLWAVFQFDDEVGIWITYRRVLSPLTFGLREGHGFYWIVEFLVAVFGSSLFIPKLVNCFLGAMIPFFVEDIGRNMGFSQAAAERARLFCGFAPPMVVFSAVYMKEIPTAALFVMSVWFLWNRHRALQRFIGFSVTLMVFYWWRGLHWAVVSLGLFIFEVNRLAWMNRDSLMGRSKLRRGVIICSTIAFSTLIGIYIIPRLCKMVINHIAYDFTSQLFGTATYMRFLNLKQVISFWNFGVYVIRGLFSPSPFRVLFDQAIDTSIEAMASMTWYLAVPYAIVGMIRHWRRPAGFGCILLTGCVFVMSTIEVLGGVPYRHRIPILPFVLLFAADGSLNTRGGYRPIFVAWIGSAAAFTVFWFVLRSA